MTQHDFFQVDAFTTKALEGNPCAVVLDADDLDAATMQSIAREMNLSETAFVLKSKVADFGARYFTPAEEIPLAGHPTISTVHVLVELGRVRPPRDGAVTIQLELRDGPIPVEVAAKGGAVTRITMSQRRPRFLRRYEPAEVLPAFGLSVGDALPGAPLETVSTGTPQLMLPLRGREALARASLVTLDYVALRERGDFFSAHLFCLEGFTQEGRTSARHFGTPPDVFEDPFTGSATGGMAAYLWRHGLIDEPAFTAEQGHLMGRPGSGRAEVVGPREDIQTVRVGGMAVTVLRGRLLV